MSQVRLSVRTTSGTNAAPALEIIAPVASTSAPEQSKGLYISAIRVTMGAATAGLFGIGRPAAKGVGPTTPVRMLPMGAGQVLEIQSAIAVAWTTTAPTIPAAFLERVNLPATIGVGVLIEFKTPVYVPAGETLILWNLGTNGVADVTVEGREG
jgi:hypothetical protein